jgi:hypothetical protein
MKTDILVHGNRIFVTDGIVNIISHGDKDITVAQALVEKVKALFSQDSGLHSIIIDAGDEGKIRKGVKRIMQNELLKVYGDRIAIHGVNPIMRFLAPIILKIKMSKDIQIFKTREDAVEWVRSFKS